MSLLLFTTLNTLTAIKRHAKNFGVIVVFLVIGLSIITQDILAQQIDDNNRFEGFEIRVIRPKYLTKTFKIEVGAQAITIFTDTFIYTVLMSLNSSFHLSESIAVELSGAYGLSFFNSSKKQLERTFNIDPLVTRANQMHLGSLVWTPIYGKFQSLGDNLVYFDTFLSLGGGAVGISYLYEHCSSRAASDGQQVKKRSSKFYPAVAGSLGQKFYISKKTSFRWDLGYSMYWQKLSDGNCFSSPNDSDKKDRKDFSYFRIGVSRFF